MPHGAERSLWGIFPCLFECLCVKGDIIDVAENN